jgi:hypothetical protein
MPALYNESNPMIDPKDEIEQLKRESLARRVAHPNWPSHRVTFTQPHGNITRITETMPIGKALGKGYCKYCYTTHGNWWAMDPREAIDVGDDISEGGKSPMLLCGRCEYTSLECFIDWEPRKKRTA